MKARESVPYEPPYKIVFEVPGCVMAAHKNVSIVIWATQATIEVVGKLDALAAAMRSTSAASAMKTSTISVVTSRAPFPTREAREKLAEITDRHAHRLACNATLISGDGFWAGAMRGLVTSLHWFEARPFRARICATVEEVAEWLPEPHLELTSVVIDPVELAAILHILEKRAVASAS
jgi:hypothetical protein